KRVREGRVGFGLEAWLLVRRDRLAEHCDRLVGCPGRGVQGERAAEQEEDAGAVGGVCGAGVGGGAGGGDSRAAVTRLGGAVQEGTGQVGEERRPVGMALRSAYHRLAEGLYGELQVSRVACPPVAPPVALAEQVEPERRIVRTGRCRVDVPGG